MIRRFILCAGLWIVLGIAVSVPSPAPADVIAVATIPTRANVQLSRPTTISITWRVTRDTIGVLPADTIFSTQGEFKIGGTTVATVNRILSLARTAGPGPDTMTFRETVVVPRHLVFQTVKMGQPYLTYNRRFWDILKPFDGSITLAPVGSGAGAFSVSRLSLTFDDGSRVRVMKRDDVARAEADVSFSGSGPLQAVWEIADPVTSGGSPIYRTLRVVRRNLAGVGRATLPSPELPTGADGLYQVRLRITEPKTGFDAPAIRYYVVPKEGAGAPREDMLLIGPARGSPLGPETRFSWRAVSGARVYIVELFETGVTLGQSPSAPVGSTGRTVEIQPSDRPVTGVIVRGDETTASLKAISLAHLEPGKTYQWRVQAIGDGGSILGESPMRQVQMP